MDVYIFTEVIRKVRARTCLLLQPLAELEDFDSEDAALEALVDQYPDYLGTEFVVFTEEPQYITVEPPPESRYAFTRRNGGSGAVVEEGYEDEVEPEEEPEEEPAAPIAVKKRPAKKRPAAKAKAAAKKRPAAKRPAATGARAGTRTGSSKRTPFTRNPGSAD